MPISRRAFVQSATALAAAAIAAPYIRASNKSGLGPITVGEGEHLYECIHDWATLPLTHAFGNTHGVAVDSDGNVHIKHTVHATSSSADAICVFDNKGTMIRSWGAEFKGGAHGLTLVREKNQDFLFVADCNRGVVRKTTLTGDPVLDLPWPEQSGLYNSKAEYKPTNVAVMPAPKEPSEPRPRERGRGAEYAGHIFVADGYGKSWIHHFAPDGRYINSFGGPGKERGQTSCPHGIAIDTRAEEPLIVIADRSNRRLQHFSLNGRHKGFVTDGLRSPCHFDQRGGLLLVPDLEARVTLLDASNKVVAQLGDGENFKLRDKSREQFVPGKFIAPHSACFDKDGNIYIVEWVEIGRVTKLRKV